PDWRTNPQAVEHARQMERLFRASRVEQRQSVVDVPAYYAQPRSTGERMAEYQRAAYPLARASLETALKETSAVTPIDISDFIVVSCTGYSAPGLDIQLARDLGMPHDVRRVMVGHMGCFGALVGLRQCLAALRAHPGAVAALLSVELTTLHFAPTLDMEVLTSFALFGDAAAALLLTTDEHARGPELVNVYCAADFATADQMSWTITDQGFVMGLSPRVPVSLRRNIAGVVAQLLAPHNLTVADVTHWLVHPGGPSILDAIRGKLELTDDQMALSWKALREHGNCSSTTVLLMLDELLRSRQANPGEWGVMMAFGPGLTLETCLLRF
ncbi:MAG: type III polyketide synthase, partial [Ktedonobacterales bacterium]